MSECTEVPVQGEVLDNRWVRDTVADWAAGFGITLPAVIPPYVWAYGGWWYQWGDPHEGEPVIKAVARNCVLTITLEA